MLPTPYCDRCRLVFAVSSGQRRAARVALVLSAALRADARRTLHVVDAQLPIRYGVELPTPFDERCQMVFAVSSGQRALRPILCIVCPAD